MSETSLPEQLFLLAVDPERRRLSGGSQLFLAMAGAVVLDLVEGDAVEVDGATLVPRAGGGTTALPVILEQQALGAMAAVRPHDARHWVSHFSAPRYQLGERIAAALERRGVIAVERSRRLGLIPTVRYTVLDTAERSRLLEAAHRALVASPPPPERLQQLLVLAAAGGLLEVLVDEPDRDAARARIDLMTREVATAQAVNEVAAQVQQQVTAAVIAATTAATVAAGAAGSGAS